VARTAWAAALRLAVYVNVNKKREPIVAWRPARSQSVRILVRILFLSPFLSALAQEKLQ
jgi:hypothetical protein